MDSYRLLVQEARTNRNKAITAARADYWRTIREIKRLHKLLEGMAFGATPAAKRKDTKRIARNALQPAKGDTGR